jgi:hypothetical protein
METQNSGKALNKLALAVKRINHPDHFLLSKRE